MYRQKRVIDGIRGLSRVSDRATVEFGENETGILDLKTSRGARWARIIEERRLANQPVYLEIDEETQLITNVRVPRTYRVLRLDPDPHDNLRVLLQPSQAVHLLLRSDPNFDSMRASLEAALGDGTERLITETRDEHEIIDVRLPSAGAGDSSGPAPPALPDPPVSEARAIELFQQMAGRSCSPTSPSSDCVTFLFPDDGCWIRAHIMCHLMRTGGPNTTTNPPEDPEKVWIDGYPLVAPTVNHPDCQVVWGWHVAPTLTVTLSGGDEKQVIDPSLSPAPESKVAWKGRQGNPAATLTDTAWTDYNFVGDNTAVSLTQALTAMQYYRDELDDRSDDFGPPPYSCTRACFLIIDRSTFSNHEIDAMLASTSPAVIQSAFYVVVDGFRPNDLGFTAATMQHVPALTVSPSVSGMTITPVSLVFEYPSHLNRRQRLTWVYNVSFTNTSAFTAELIPIHLQATMSTVSGAGTLYLTTQPNPYEVDGATSWLSTDLRVFQLTAVPGQSKFNASLGSNPNAFITQVIANLNSGNTGGQTFENDISTDQNTSRLELSTTVDGTAVYNFAVAKVRYRALTVSATDVRVFFRMFPYATTSLSYDASTEYRSHASGGTIVPLLGVRGGETSSIPCFASPRIDSSSVSLTAQTDLPNVQVIPANSSGAEVVRYFGCWLDFNQTQPQFPIAPSSADGPWSSGRMSIYDLIRNEHQCLVAEIAFTPSPIPTGATPSDSDKLAQRNLAIVASANPGHVNSRRIPQTFELQPSSDTNENDELMIDWGNIPTGSVATLYIPGLSLNDMVLLAAKKYRAHRLIRIDEHTIRMATGGMTYLPIPFTSATLPGLLTIDLPEGVKRGEAYKVVVRQVTTTRRQFVRTTKVFAEAVSNDDTARQIVGSFQLTIPVRVKDEMLPGQQRLLSNLRWIERAIPSQNRWMPVFSRYVQQVAQRVDALGGDSSKVAPSSSGQWKEAYRNCLLLMLLTILLIAVFVIGAGTQAGGTVLVGGVAVLVLLAIVVGLWRRTCRPTWCRLLIALLAGTAIGALVLAVLLLFGMSTPQLISALLGAAGLALVTAVVAWVKGCF